MARSLGSHSIFAAIGVKAPVQPNALRKQLDSKPLQQTYSPLTLSRGGEKRKQALDIKNWKVFLPFSPDEDEGERLYAAEVILTEDDDEDDFMKEISTVKNTLSPSLATSSSDRTPPIWTSSDHILDSDAIDEMSETELSDDDDDVSESDTGGHRGWDSHDLMILDLRLRSVVIHMEEDANPETEGFLSHDGLPKQVPSPLSSRYFFSPFLSL